MGVTAVKHCYSECGLQTSSISSNSEQTPVLPLENKIWDHAQFPLILHGGMLVITTLYMRFRASGYLKFGATTQGHMFILNQSYATAESCLPGARSWCEDPERWYKSVKLLSLDDIYPINPPQFCVPSETIVHFAVSQILKLWTFVVDLGICAAMICLTSAPGLRCGTQDLHCGMRDL
ncbi:proton-coupled amino acid transporter 2-like [Physeter macrocephalus]|uniref:Proton-coupled amino acid transporter 2-like n=1 Tax=Physeter macrocephalus TaxID=9755 RepID=A0A9W2WUQ2_PHYMC|nr:proton-coupled amino acid transporter 2-like [Physeter catodon]